MLEPDFLLDADSRRRLVTRFGTGVESWFAALPGLVERYCQRWHLELDEALSGSTSRVFVGRQRGGGGVVLKLSPEQAIAEEEALALRAWAATPHVAGLLDADLEHGALLLEKIEPGTKVSDEPAPPPAGEVAALFAGLRSAASHDFGRLPTLADRVQFLFARISGLRSDPRISPLVAAHLVAGGRRAARDLASDGPAELVHGDLHLQNMLRAGAARGLVAIDPRPCSGDPAFDAIDWTLDRVTSADEARERVRQLGELIPDLDRDRLWRWCQATAVALAVLRLRRHPLDDTTQLLLQLANCS